MSDSGPQSVIVGDTDVGSPGGPAPAPSSEAGSGAGGGSGAGACTVAEACDGAARAVATAGEAVVPALGEAPAGFEPGMLVSMDDLKPREVPRDRVAVVALADIVGRRVRVSVLDGRVFYGLLAVCLRACRDSASVGPRALTGFDFVVCVRMMACLMAAGGRR